MHGAAIVDGNIVKREMQLGRQIKWHLLRALRFHNPLVLPEDCILERLQDRVWLVQIIVAPDDAITAAMVLIDWLCRKK